MNKPGNLAVTNAPADVEYASIEATVIRCGCGDPLAHASQGLPCPSPCAIDNRGVISEYRRPGPFVRWAKGIMKGGR